MESEYIETEFGLTPTLGLLCPRDWLFCVVDEDLFYWITIDVYLGYGIDCMVYENQDVIFTYHDREIEQLGRNGAEIEIGKQTILL